MPETAAAGDAYEVKIVGLQEGQVTNNVMHFVAANSDSDVLIHLITVLAVCFVNNLLPVLANTWVLTHITWKRVSPTLGNEFIFVPAGAGGGGEPSQALPSFVSAVVSKRTEQGGRSHRGRMYIAGIPENATFGSLLDSNGNFWLGLLAFINCVLTNFKPGDPPGQNTWYLAVYSRKIGGTAFPYQAAGFTRVSSLTPLIGVGTTRSRKVGRGS